MMRNGAKTNKTVRRVMIPLTVFIVMLTLSLTVYAAYFGLGFKKGVLVSSEYFFTSNSLVKVTENTTAAVNPHRVPCATGADIQNGANHTTTTEKQIVVRNFNDIGNFNTFGIAYNLYAWLDGTDSSENGSFAYTIDNNTISATTPTLVGIQTSLLQGGAKDSETHTIKWVWTGTVQQDLSKAARICVVAVPTSPDYMTSNYIGASFYLSESAAASTEFHYESGFEDIAEPDASAETSSIINKAGFVYVVTVSGEPAGRSATLVWNSGKISPTTDPAGTTTAADGTKSCSFVLEADRVYRFVFFRQYDTEDAGADDWNENDEFDSALYGYIQFTVSDPQIT